jgi:hypothetical protein
MEASALPILKLPEAVLEWVEKERAMDIKPIYNIKSEQGKTRIGITMDFDDADAVMEALKHLVGIAIMKTDEDGAVRKSIDATRELFMALHQAKKI